MKIDRFDEEVRGQVIGRYLISGRIYYEDRPQGAMISAETEEEEVIAIAETRVAESYPELKRAVDYGTYQIGGQWLAPWRGCDWIAFALLGLDVQELLNGELEERSDAFWAPAGGAQSVDLMGNEFLIGFIEGAVQVWNQVRNQL